MKKSFKSSKPSSVYDGSKKGRFTSLYLLNEYGDLSNRFSKEKLNDEQSNHNTAQSSNRAFQVLSTDGIMKLARARLLQSSSQNTDAVVSSIMINDSFADSLADMPPEMYADFELALLLHASALKFSNQQFDRARKLLSLCEQSASVNGNTIQRLVYYFTKALQERINREMTIEVPPPSLGVEEEIKTHRRKKRLKGPYNYLEAALSILQLPIVKFQQETPFCSVTHFTAIQAILENVASAKRVHLIDLGIKSGSHWTIMMQAFADRYEYDESCPLELLKLTAVAVGSSKQIIEEIGKMLSSFAEHNMKKIPFQFNVVHVPAMENLKGELFEVADNEELVVFSELRLAHFLALPNGLESVLGEIKKLHPCLMVVIELEANTNAPFFMDRFSEGVSLCAACFDCLNDCMERDNELRATIEGLFIREGIESLVIFEGKERVHRHQKMDHWRALFARFELVELALSETALYQAHLLVKSNPRWISCTLQSDTDGKCLILGWKETPVQVLSLWKFLNT